MTNSRRILIPVPLRDFDPTEVALSWRILRDAGHRIEFATVDGTRGHADPMMLSGEGLDPWGWLPGLRKLRLFGLMLRADHHGRQAYAALEYDPAFLQPKRFQDLNAAQYDALLLPGGHAKGMRPYLEDKVLQAVVADFFDSDKPVAAICHGVLLAARSVSPRTQRSVLYGRKTTALTWKLERSAWDLTRFLARFWDPGYYRTYGESKGEPAGYWSVEQEVKRALASPADFIDVPSGAPDYFRKTGGLVRDRAGDDRAAWVVRGGNYLSARWPGDVHTFARRYADLLAES
ncbi:thiJ/pfpI-family protein [Duganella sp. BJB488]|uniref:type 1 glutamine amidotransferase domain-containing protein n=1 Tax=unclassified Duganella TaxID=2636909 RepID=UPI000E3448F7|nr:MULTISPECIES: type 1 glutamine amidotransferase domain-containing protein [unclassified Duganella]RFP17611.1 thiJ/pfpI-family protein [Duganella sp. BJB489]RFP22120.1 thiJ/pfpI-family protein [Duganella sp. BJB488]RFP37455.1 thiJ/pfpI-family protein [Duganella sp. BJB480]